MEQLERCFCPSRKFNRHESLEIDETTLEFVETAVKSGESSEEELTELVESLFPWLSGKVERSGLSARILIYREELSSENSNLARKNVVGDCQNAIEFVMTRRDSDCATVESLESLHTVPDESNEATSSEIEFLRGLCGVSDASQDKPLSYLLTQKAFGDLQEAARLLIDTSVEALNAELRADEQRRAERAKAEKDAEFTARERVLGKFHEVPDDSVAYVKVKNQKPNKSTTTLNESKVRYLDGKVVATNGAKYIEVQTKEDWDGGSRGRVKTKGKRGTGWAT